MVNTVHDVLFEYMKGLIDSNQLKGQEFFILLSWQDTYKSNYFMGHPNLGIDISKIPDLLDNSYYTKVLEEHIIYTQSKIREWFQNAIDKNFVEWQSNVMPDTIEGNYESKMSNDLNTMLVQQV
jgi:hypothetical protein